MFVLRISVQTTIYLSTILKTFVASLFFMLNFVGSAEYWCCKMSGLKVDVQWSPVDDDIFITYGTAVNLYQTKERDGMFEPLLSGIAWETTKLFQKLY